MSLALVLLLAACGEDSAARARRAEARVLRREIENLREIRDAARARTLVDPRWLAVAVDETAVRTLLDAGLPQETDLANRFHVRIEDAAVTFRSGASLVRFKAEVLDR